MHTRPPDLFIVSLAVGVFAAASGRLFTWLFMPQVGFDFGLPAFAYAWISPAVLFTSAAATFAIAFGVLPSARGHARRAGLIAAVATYVCHAAWIAIHASAVNGGPAMSIFVAAIAMFLVIGWLPILAGLFAGWCVERWQRLPIAESGGFDAGPTGVVPALKFGLVGALISVPLIFVVHGMARRSRVDFALFFPTAPFVVFGLAAAAFWLCHSLLPAFALRGRVAGVLAALITFVSFLFWLRFAVNIATRDGLPFGSPFAPFNMAFVLVGWVPAVFGGLAGRWATRR